MKPIRQGVNVYKNTEYNYCVCVCDVGTSLATYKEGQRLSASTSQGSPDPPVHKHLPGPSSRLSSPPDAHPPPPDADQRPTLAEPISHSPSPDPGKHMM